LKCKVPDAGDAVGDCDSRQLGALREGRVPDTDEVGAERYAAKTGAAIKRRVPDVYNAVADFNICQVNAVKERPVSYAIDVGATRDAGQADADSERIVPDAIYPRISNSTL
jgi:hypothetical protein